MKNIKTLISGMIRIFAMLPLLMISCSEDDDRVYEDVRIVGVNIDNELYTPSYNGTETIIILPEGRDLSNVKLQVIVANGQLINFVNETEYDARKPIEITLKAYNGKNVETRLRIQSPPKLSFLIIEGLTIPNEDIHTSESSVIVQVPEDTDLSALKVTMEFINGTLLEFENGKALDYTDPVEFSIKGVDEETIYPYELIITTQPVGPAFVKAMKIAGIETDSVTIDGTVLTPHIPALINFSSVDVELEVGFGNKVDPDFTGKGLNLLTGANKVKVIGTNGITTEFTIGVPQLSFVPLFAKKYSEMGLAANDLGAIGFSGSYLLAVNYGSGTRMPEIYDMSGAKVGRLDNSGVDVTGYGIRKFATDDKGAVLILSLGMSSGEQWVTKFDNATAQGTKYISFSKASLGVDYDPRSAGISITGSLDGDAIITIGMAQKTDIFVWEVKGGILNPTPKKYGFPYSGTSYYWSIQPMPVGMKGFIGFATANNPDFYNGIITFDENMQEVQKLTGMVVTDGKVIEHKGRLYMAYTAHGNEKGMIRICDITSGEPDAYRNPIFNKEMEETGGNTNATVDADFAVINGKLHVAFSCTNIGLYVYALE